MPTQNLDLVTGERLDIQVYQGNTIEPVFTFTTGSAPAVPLDLTGVTIGFQIRRCEDSAELLKEFTSAPAGGITISGAGNNVVTIDGVIDIAGGVYKYDMRFTYPSPDSRVVTYLYGDITVTKKVTRTA